MAIDLNGSIVIRPECFLNSRHLRLRFHSHTIQETSNNFQPPHLSYGIKQPKGEAHMEEKELHLVSLLLFEILELLNPYPEIWEIIKEIIVKFEFENDIIFQKF